MQGGVWVVEEEKEGVGSSAVSVAVGTSAAFTVSSASITTSTQTASLVLPSLPCTASVSGVLSWRLFTTGDFSFVH